MKYSSRLNYEGMDNYHNRDGIIYKYNALYILEGERI